MMLTVAGIASAVAIINAIYPALTRSSSAVITASGKVDDRLKSDIEIIHVAAEVDANGAFSDTNANGKFDIFVWVKNVGDTRIFSVTDVDVFLGQTGEFVRVPHQSEVNSTVYPRWRESIENDTEWAPKATLKITVTYETSTPEPSGTYYVKVIAPNGVSDEAFFSI